MFKNNSNYTIASKSDRHVAYYNSFNNIVIIIIDFSLNRLEFGAFGFPLPTRIVYMAHVVITYSKEDQMFKINKDRTGDKNQLIEQLFDIETEYYADNIYKFRHEQDKLLFALKV